MGTRVRIEIPNATGTGPILDEDDLARLPGERSPMLTNRHYILDKDTFGHVPLFDGNPLYPLIVEARLDVRTIVLTVDVGHAGIASFIRLHGDPAPGYAGVMSGENGLRLAEIGLAPPLVLPEPEPEQPDTLAPWLYWRFGRDPLGAPWESLDEDYRSRWEHEAEAVRRAVARGGFSRYRSASSMTREEARDAAAPRS
jgi:hypothetical protein